MYRGRPIFQGGQGCGRVLLSKGDKMWGRPLFQGSKYGMVFLLPPRARHKKKFLIIIKTLIDTAHILRYN